MKGKHYIAVSGGWSQSRDEWRLHARCSCGWSLTDAALTEFTDKASAHTAKATTPRGRRLKATP